MSNEIRKELRKGELAIKQLEAMGFIYEYPKGAAPQWVDKNAADWEGVRKAGAERLKAEARIGYVPAHELAREVDKRTRLVNQLELLAVSNSPLAEKDPEVGDLIQVDLEALRKLMPDHWFFSKGITKYRGKVQAIGRVGPLTKLSEVLRVGSVFVQVSCQTMPLCVPVSCLYVVRAHADI